MRRKKACACCDCIVQAAAPSRPIQRSFAGPGLLANIAVSKFADHQPLYRQAVMLTLTGHIVPELEWEILNMTESA